MLFNRSFWITLSGTFVGGVMGIWMAYSGFGIWSLVWSSLAGGGISTGMRWFLIGWRPGFHFSWQRLRSLFTFGSRLLVVSLLDTFFSQIYGLIIGKWYSAADLAYFNRGEHLPQVVMNSVQGSIGSVVFPAMSKIQDDKAKLKRAMRKVMQTSSFIVFPMMFGLAAVAKPLVLVLLTEKWLPAVPFMQLACISYAFWPIHVANLQAIQACGRSDVFLKLDIIKKGAMLITLVMTFRHGVLAMALGRVALAPLSVWLNSFPNKDLINYSQREQCLDLLPTLFTAVGMALLVLLSLELFSSEIFQVMIGGALGISVYLLLSVAFRLVPESHLATKVFGNRSPFSSH